MLMACVCNPIFINTFVVFVRLFWFEKRFQSIVLDAQRLRRTKERSRTKSQAVDEERDAGTAEEQGVGSKKITVMRPNQPDRNGKDAEKGAGSSSETGSSDEQVTRSSDDGKRDDRREDLSPTTNLPRAITFADQVSIKARRESVASRVPAPRSRDESIAFVQKQNNPSEYDTLYIPGPRDFDRGAKPKNIHNNTDDGIVDRKQAKENLPSAVNAEVELNGDDHPTRAPNRTQTSSSDPALITSPVSHRLVERMREHLPFHHHDPEHDADSIAPVQPRRSRSSDGLRRRDRSRTFASFLSTAKTETKDPMPYLSYHPTIGRNSAFVNLTEEQREELGGIEYRALKLLAAVLCCYFVGFQVLGLLSFLPWIENSSAYYKGTLDSDGINRGWWGAFTSASMFNDLGFTLTPDSMNSFGDAVWILLMGSFLIIIGNTGFPCMLRFVIWTVSMIVPKRWPLWEELQFLLDHPRRCFTLLFPSKATWWLFWVLVLLNGIDLMFFVILDLHGTPVSGFSGGLKVLDGIFQAASTRTAGFAVVNVALLHPAIQVSYLIMMYISVFPIAISIRRTNVYEEKSLGVYKSADVPDDEDEEHSYVGAHLRRQLSFDLWYVFLGLFIITIVEGDRLQSTNDWAFTIFAVLFEVVSAYGTVGLSLGYPNTDPSFSAQFHTISKLVIIAMQIRGRHRGLPYALDKAVLLPSETLQSKEQEEANRRAAAAGATVMIDEKGRAPTQTKTGLDGIADGLDESRTMTDAKSTGEGTMRARRLSLGRLLSNALGAGPTMSRKLD